LDRKLLFYLVVVLIFGLGIYLTLRAGSRLEAGRQALEQRHEHPSATASLPRGNQTESALSKIRKVLSENLRDPLSILLLQVTVILLAARLVGILSLKIGQPPVIGEMVAGIILGPSLLGLAFPQAFSFLFPTSSIGTLKLLSQIGVILFMFTVGMELNEQQLREKARAAILISHASIVTPFFLGIAISLLIYRSFAPPAISFTSFALFMGVAMSVTAFPVLARIIEERGISNSYLGNTALACAAVDDVSAWCILALIIAIVKTDGIAASALTIVLALAFTALMLFIIKPQLNRVIGKNVEREKNAKGIVAGALAFLFVSAYFTEVIGIHAIFGSFLAGVIMPSTTGFRTFLREKLATFSSVALLPLFFAFTGLRTQINLLDDLQSWLVCLGIIAVAIAGKLGGSMLAARWAGMSWHDSISIGALMNTRGLMELIVLNIGYDLGILPERIFSIMVLMALVTTCMAGPLLSLIELVRRNKPTFNHESVGEY
jgi:Kef-type K+ transport system membrane component KefB